MMSGNGKTPDQIGGVDNDGQDERTIGDAARAKEEAKAGLADLTEEVVRSLARKEIEKWHAEAPKLFQPKTWGRRTLGGAIAGSLVVIGVGIYSFLNLDAEKISAQFHTAVGTEREVQDALDELSQTGATADNPIFRLIGRTMRQAPVLAFHGEQTFGRSFEVKLPNRECQERRREEAESVSSDEFEELPLPAGAMDLEDVADLCAIQGVIDFGLDLDIPFHARFFETGNGAPPHRAFLVAFIRRTSTDEETEIGDETDAQGRPTGLCFLYKPASPAAGIKSLPITDFEGTGNGFWSADLTGSLKEAGVWDAAPINPDATTSLHSIVIEGVSLASENGGPEPSAGCTHVSPPNEAQIISVSAMILVNKKAYE